MCSNNVNQKNSANGASGGHFMQLGNTKIFRENNTYGGQNQNCHNLENPRNLITSRRSSYLGGVGQIHGLKQRGAANEIQN